MRRGEEVGAMYRSFVRRTRVDVLELQRVERDPDLTAEARHARTREIVERVRAAQEKTMREARSVIDELRAEYVDSFPETVESKASAESPERTEAAIQMRQLAEGASFGELKAIAAEVVISGVGAAHSMALARARGLRQTLNRNTSLAPEERAELSGVLNELSAERRQDALTHLVGAQHAYVGIANAFRFSDSHTLARAVAGSDPFFRDAGTASAVPDIAGGIRHLSGVTYERLVEASGVGLRFDAA